MAKSQSAEASYTPVPVSALQGAEGWTASIRDGEGNEQLRTAVLDFLSLFLKALICSSNF